MTVNYGAYGSSLRDLPRLRSTRRRRASSWDRTGGNDDRLTLRPGQSATLADINQSERNITTIEDPVEYVFSSINQIQINESAGITFADGLRSILRQAGITPEELSDLL